MGLFDAIGNKINSLPSIERRRLENEMKREQLSAMKRQNSAIDQMGLLMNNDAPSAIRATPEQTQQRMMGLLPAIAPQSVAQGLLATDTPKESRYAPTIRMLEERGVNLSDDQLLNMVGANPQTDPTQMLEYQTALAEYQKLIEEQRRQNETLSQGRAREAAEVKTSLEDIAAMQDALEVIENTALQAGVPYPELRRAMLSSAGAVTDVLGSDFDPSPVLEARDTFIKSSARFAAKTANRRFGASPTNAQLEQVLSFTPSLEYETGANRNIMADMVRDLMTEAEIAEIDIDSDRYTQLMAELKGGSVMGVVRQVPNYHNLSPQEKQELRARVAKMTPEQRAQLLRSVNGR